MKKPPNNRRNNNRGRKKKTPKDIIEKQKKAASTRKRIKSLLGNECFICGYRSCLKALELHHVNPSKKNFNISMNVLRYKWATLVKEVMLCVLVCNRCHSEVEEGIIIVEEKDVPKQYYEKLVETTKPARNKFKSKSYAKRKQKRRASSDKNRYKGSRKTENNK